MSSAVVFQRGDFEGVPVFQEFDVVLGKLSEAYRENVAFLVLERDSTNRVAFCIPEVRRIEEVI